MGCQIGVQMEWAVSNVLSLVGCNWLGVTWLNHDNLQNSCIEQILHSGLDAIMVELKLDLHQGLLYIFFHVSWLCCVHWQWVSLLFKFYFCKVAPEL